MRKNPKAWQAGFGITARGYINERSDTRMTRRDRQKINKDLPCAELRSHLGIAKEHAAGLKFRCPC